ncbi:MAG: beta-propeller domain-containing protein [Marmoricola sp.]
MRRLSKVALGGTVASAALVGGLAAAGVFATTAAIVVTDPAAPPAHADGLEPFSSCGALLAWYVDRGVGDVGPYGWDRGVIMYADTMRMPAAAALKGLDNLAMSSDAGTTDARGSSATGTNTQEADVDEPDTAKTDGSLVARIVADRRLVLVDVAHGAPTVTHRYWLPTDGYGAELLLLGDHVLITQSVTGQDRKELGGDLSGRVPFGYGYGAQTTRLLDIDISDPSAPHLLSSQVFNGSLLAMRQYGETVRLVTSTPRPQLAFVHPHHGLSAHDALLRNRAVVRASTIDDWLPAVTRDGTSKTLTGCADVYHPKAWSGPSTVAVTTFPAADPTTSSSVAITADGGVVYSSADRLYVTSSNAFDRPVCMTCDLAMPRRPDPVRTQVHAFALDGGRTTYAASGEVLGTLRDRWSLDEHGGDLRAAWTRSGPRGGTTNGITVLTEKDGSLDPIGTVAGLGTDEDIQSVRWFDDLAIVVTFRQIDPLYTIDLSDPTHPRKLGALKMTGYSGYLHPIGDGRVLGLGMQADGRGSVSGTQAAVFDITDPTHPLRLSRVELAPGEAGIGALDDPRGFTWVPGSATGITAVNDWRTGHSRLVALHVDGSGTLSRHVVADLNQDWQVRTLALPDGRIAVLDAHRLRVVDLG